MSALVVRNPATGEILAELPAATKADVEDAVRRARAAQPAWAARPVSERASLLSELQKRLLASRREVADLITRETGKPIVESMGSDVLSALDALQWTVTKGPKLLSPTPIRLSNPLLMGRKSWIDHEPLGVVGIISPWNYPLAIPAANVAHALLAGNTVVVKPASYTPLVMLKLRELATEAGIPADVFLVLPGAGREAGDALVNAGIDHLVFTGSVPVGHDVDRKLRERGISTTMELGGSDPAIIFEDANFDNAVAGVTWARFTNAGQTCAATKRAFVHRSIYDRFVAAVVERTGALRLGDPLDPHVDIGCLTDPRSVQDMTDFVEDARKRGGRVLTGGRARPDVGPNRYDPTIVVDLPRDARLLTEECFGPILPIVPFDTEDEAIALANASRFGLCATVWTSEADRGARIAKRLSAGTVTVNDSLYVFAANETPWGGVKDSGHGKTHGAWGLREMTREKHVNTTPASLRSTWWFPYSPGLRDTYDAGTRFLYGTTADKAKTGMGLTSNLLRRLRPKK